MSSLNRIKKITEYSTVLGYVCDHGIASLAKKPEMLSCLLEVMECHVACDGNDDCKVLGIRRLYTGQTLVLGRDAIVELLKFIDTSGILDVDHKEEIL